MPPVRPLWTVVSGVAVGLATWQLINTLDFVMNKSPEELLHFLASFGASVFVLSVVFIFNVDTRRIINTHPIQFLEREILPSRYNIFARPVRITWPEDWIASNTKIIKLHLRQESNTQVKVEITVRSDQLNITQDQLNITQLRENDEEVQIIFPARVAGQYKVHVWLEGGSARGSPWTREVLPGLPHPLSCTVVGPWAPRSARGIVCTAGDTSTSYLQIRDSFHNIVNCTSSDCDDVSLQLDLPCWTETSLSSSSQISLTAFFPLTCTGAFTLRVKYRDQLLSTVQFLVLNTSQYSYVSNSLSEVSKFGFNSYHEASLTKLAGESLPKPKTVFVYLKEKQLIIKEFYLKIIPHKIISYKVNPQVNLKVVNDSVVITQKDLSEMETILTGPAALSLSAAYYLTLGRRLGGKETFREKQDLFYTSLQRHHEEKFHKHVRIPLNISRTSIFDSTIRATRFFLESDWARLFEIRFEGEPGQDQGGVRREWMDLVTRHIFLPRNGMFLPVEEGRLAVQPNPFPPAHVKLKHYRLAGKLVGKCLYESAMGSTYRFNLNARLAKSFLTQIIGIDVDFTMLATDAPELWETKIKYIIDNDVTDLELFFTQDELRDGRVCTVDLVPGGAQKTVTEDNKKQYLSCLAKYLLVERIEKQMEAFMEGLHTLVPEHLLTIWDEDDLELLLCGIRDYSVEDLKQNHILVGMRYGRFCTVLDWFWQALAHLPREDMARFVQFTTGSSLLPPGGWADLAPKLQISWGAGEPGTLPTSHTCFNHLVLPNADSYQQLERVLLTALREGSEGFLLA